jgi:antitoxin component YwqK of YwqJK toxin-antitoxin module
MAAQRVILFLILGCSFSSFSQKITKLKEFKVKGVEGLTVDRLGNFFLIFKNGEIKKYDPNGKLLASLKGKRGNPTLLEPWYHPSIFIYYRDKQEWVVYDRELKNPQINQIDPSIAINPYLVCPTNDNKLLVLDKADYSVKRVNRFTNEALFEFAIDTNFLSKSPNFTFIREYQNMIFLLDKNSGILVFNNIGKLINRIGNPGIVNFGFYGEELFYIQSDQTPALFDLYTEKKRLIPLEKIFNQMCITDERVIEIDNCNKLKIYSLVDSPKAD